MGNTMKRTQRRERDSAWCEVEVELEGTPQPARLSIHGREGRIVSRTSACAESQEYWESNFADPTEIRMLNAEFNKRFRSPASAARFLRSVDGEMCGLDVHDEDLKANKVYLIESCGQIRDVIAQWFPEVVPYFKWHLNVTELPQKVITWAASILSRIEEGK